MKPREDLGTPADGFFDALDDAIAPLARALRTLIRLAIPQATESIRWGMPVYVQGKMICSIRPAKDYIALQFYQSGIALPDPDGLLEGTGKRMRHVKIRKCADIKKELFASWIRQAASSG